MVHLSFIYLFTHKHLLIQVFHVKYLLKSYYMSATEVHTRDMDMKKKEKKKRI